MAKNEKLNHVRVPPTTDETIVFGFNFAYSKFDKSHYKPSMTNHLIQDEELNQFLRDLEIQVQTNIKQCEKDKMLRFFCFVFFFVATVSLIVSLHAAGAIGDNPYKIVLSVFLSFLGLSFLVFCFYFVKFFIKSKNLARDVSQKAKDYVEEKGKEFQAKGLTWVIPPFYPSWIELWRDKLPPVDPSSRQEDKIQDECKSKKLVLSQSLSAIKEISLDIKKSIQVAVESEQRQNREEENFSVTSPSTANSSFRFLTSRIRKSSHANI